MFKQQVFMSVKIKSIKAREVLDSRGFPTVEVEIQAGEFLGRAIVPSGASTGVHEAIELRDGDQRRYLGKGVLIALKNVDKIAEHLVGKDPSRQVELDELMIKLDKTPNKGRLGANAILAISLALCRVSALSQSKPLYQYLAETYEVPTGKYLLPLPMMNVINGGKHADSGLDLQEFMLVPIGAKKFSDALRMGAEVFQTLKKILKEKDLATSVGDEGGFAPKLKTNRAALELLVAAIETAGYRPGVDISLALDAAASSFFLNEGYYQINERNLTAIELIQYYQHLAQDYPLCSLEDGLAEDDWDNWDDLTRALGEHVQIVGDDLFVTNLERIETGIKRKSANAVLIKLNQIGTVTETARAIQLTQKAGWHAVVSHRSGETEDTFIADLAVGLQAGQIKSGSLSRSERIAKYNQLLRIEEELKGRSTFFSY